MTLRLVTDDFIPTKNVSNKTLEEIITIVDNEMNGNNEYLESQDAIDSYIDCIASGGLDNAYLDAIECPDDRDMVQYLIENNQDALFDMCTNEMIYGIHSVSNELLSQCLGETEHQLSDALTKRILGLTNHDIKEVFNTTDFYFNADNIIEQKDKKYPSIEGYINRDYDRYSLILDIDLLHEFFSNNLNVA